MSSMECAVRRRGRPLWLLGTNQGSTDT